jgi:hypothetical protein
LIGYGGIKMEGTNIYFIGSVISKAVKIGMSGDPESRLAEIQRGHPNKLTLYKVVYNVTMEYELKVHKMFNTSVRRVNGSN